MGTPSLSTQIFINPPEDNVGVDKALTDIYTNPNFVEPFGLGTANVTREGTIYRANFAAAGVSPGATGADNVIATFLLPANSFDIAGRGISITAQGKFAANANTKQVKIIFNPVSATLGSTVGASGTTIADTAAQVSNGVGWLIGANVYKIGAAGSNTQYAQCDGAWAGGTHLGGGASNLPVFPTATENAGIFIAVTGNATTTATDIVLNSIIITALN